jgi:Rhodopirellula transposase DDE domain
MQPYPIEVEQQMQRFYHSLSEKDRRRYAAVEALKLGWGGLSYISGLLGCDDEAMQLGKRELGQQEELNQSRVRRAGGGRKAALATIAGLDAAFLRVIAKHTAGSPMDETIKWTNLTRHEIARLLRADGINVSVSVVDQLLEKHNYRKRKAQKRLATGAHPQRNEQFENIERIKANYQAVGNPVLSMDTKKEN